MRSPCGLNPTRWSPANLAFLNPSGIGVSHVAVGHPTWTGAPNPIPGAQGDARLASQDMGKSEAPELGCTVSSKIHAHLEAQNVASTWKWDKHGLCRWN